MSRRRFNDEEDLLSEVLAIAAGALVLCVVLLAVAGTLTLLRMVLQ